eukprot:jgi/Mesvir1/11312/Mv25183-RA.1
MLPGLNFLPGLVGFAGNAKRINATGWGRKSWTTGDRDVDSLPSALARDDSSFRQVQLIGADAESLPAAHRGFRPYRQRIPWHEGTRGTLCSAFPRHGAYCGPNWSSGRSSGSGTWDVPPESWVDRCCYFHDIGYDSMDQSDLLAADQAFASCLARRPLEPTGQPAHAGWWGELYGKACLQGIRHLLVPYRRGLLAAKDAQETVDTLISMGPRALEHPVFLPAASAFRQGNLIARRALEHPALTPVANACKESSKNAQQLWARVAPVQQTLTISLAGVVAQVGTYRMDLIRPLKPFLDSGLQTWLSERVQQKTIPVI